MDARMANPRTSRRGEDRTKRRSSMMKETCGNESPVTALRDKAEPRYRVLVFLLALLLGLGSIAGKPFAYHDELRVAGIAREMAIEGDYAVPRLNGKPFLEYPSLGYIPLALLMNVAERPSTFVVHLASLLAGVGTLFIVFLIGRTLGGERVGLLAALVLQTTFAFLNIHSKILVDPWLAFWITLSLYGFIAGYRAPRNRFLFFSLWYFGAACAFLTKGLVGLGLPGITAAVFLACRRDFAAVRDLRPWWGLVIFAAPILLWIYGTSRAEGAGHLSEVWRQSVWRFSSSEAHHAAPVYSYLSLILSMALPWTLFMPAVLWRHFAPSRWNVPLATTSDGLFPRVWLAAMFIALSLASAKRKLYLAPVLPSIALLVALWWDGAVRCEKAPALDRFFLRLFPIAGAVFLVAAAVTMFVVGPVGLAVGAALIVAGAAWLLRAHRRDLARPAPALGFFLVCYLLGAGAFNHAWVLPGARSDSIEPFFETISREWRDREIVLYHPTETYRGAMVFYLGRRVPVAQEIKDAIRWADEEPQALFIAEGKYLDELVSALGPRPAKVLLSAQAGENRAGLVGVAASATH